MIAKWLMIAGVLLLFIGAALQFAPWLATGSAACRATSDSNPATIVFLIPIMSMIVLSLVLTLIINLFKRSTRSVNQHRRPI